VTPESRDFGKEVYRLVLQEAALHPLYSHQRQDAVRKLNRQWDIADTFNQIVPKATIVGIEQWLRRLLPLYDDHSIPTLTRGLARILERAGQDRELANALVSMEKRTGLFPALQSGDGSMTSRLLGFDKHRELLLQFGEWWMNYDGFQDDGISLNPQQQPPIINRAMQLTGDWLKRVNRRSEKREPSLIIDALLTEDSRLDLNIGVRCAVRFDADGQPIMTEAGRQASVGGVLPPPFPDANVRRGQCGEALSDSGMPLYEVRTLSHSVLGSILLDMRGMIAQQLPVSSERLPFPFNLPVAIAPLLGTPEANGQASSQSPLLQTIRAALNLLKGPQLYNVLRLFARITEKEEQRLVELLSLFEQIAGISSRHTSSVSQAPKIFDDLIPHIQEILANTEMIEDLIKVMQQPGLMENFQRSMALLLKYTKDKITIEEYMNFQNNNENNIFVREVNRGLPDRAGNLSFFQRVLHMMHDVHLQPYRSNLEVLTNVPEELPFLEMRIDDLAMAYMRSLAGQLSIWETIYVNGKPIEDGSIKDQLRNSLPAMGLSEWPNPEELGIYINRELIFTQVPLLGSVKVDLRLKPIKCKAGYYLRDHCADALLAGLASGLIARDGGVVRPIAQVFAKYNKLRLILDILEVFHRHWASIHNDQKQANGSPVYLEPRTDLRSTEPMLIEVFEQTDIFGQFSNFGKLVLNTKLSEQPNAPNGLPALQQYLAFVVGKPGQPVANTPIKPMLDAFDSIDQIFARPENRRAYKAWDDAMRSFDDLLWKIAGVGSQARFANHRVPVVLFRILDFTANEIEKRYRIGQWQPDLSRVQRELEELLTDPMMPALLDLFETLSREHKLVQTSTELLVHLLPDPRLEPQRFGELLNFLAVFFAPVPDDIRMPVSRFLGYIMETEISLFSQSMAFLRRVIPLDPEDQFLSLLKRATVSHPRANHYYISLLPQLLTAFYRQDPGSSAPLSANDYRLIFQQMQRFLLDPQKGVEKFYEIIKARNGSN
jgi:hypothetical protein